MPKTNAERQKDYRERKKMKLGDVYLEKERKSQKQFYVKVSALSNADAKKRREGIRERVKKYRGRAKERNVADAPDD